MSKKSQSSPASPLSKTTNEPIKPIIMSKRTQTNSNHNSSSTDNLLTEWVIVTPKNNKRPSSKSPENTESLFTTPNRYSRTKMIIV